ncbi:DUF5329 family protein [Diaphorobacter sp. NR2-3-3-1]|nr:DUF5329 family protein [Diaphorobacter caeni]
MSLPAAPALALSGSEEARVQAMLALLEKRSDLVFIRNGESHSAVDAVAHLKLKLSRTRNRLDSAEQFVDKVASSSSMSGAPYLIQQSGKPSEPAKPFLQQLLKQASQHSGQHSGQ